MTQRYHSPVRAASIRDLNLCLPWPCVLCVALCFLCGCTKTIMHSSHLLGAKRNHLTQCSVADSPTNRAAIAEVVRSVAQRHQLRNDTEEWRARFVRTFPQWYTNQPNLDRLTNQIAIASFVPTNAANRYTDLRMYVSANHGAVAVTLSQKKWSKQRSEIFATVNETLVSSLTERFGTNVSVGESATIMFK